jgi:hypothetical protein
MSSNLLYIPEHLMGVEARTSFGRSRRHITMTDNLGTGKHLINKYISLSSALMIIPTNVISKEQVKYPTFCQLLMNWEEADRKIVDTLCKGRRKGKL